MDEEEGYVVFKWNAREQALPIADIDLIWAELKPPIAEGRTMSETDLRKELVRVRSDKRGQIPLTEPHA